MVHLLVFKSTNIKGLEGGPIGRVLASEAEGPESDSQNPTKILGMGPARWPLGTLFAVHAWGPNCDP